MYRIVTNNSLCRDKYQELIPVDFLEGKGYMDVLLAVRDYIQKGWRLETHPMTGSLKPNHGIGSSPGTGGVLQSGNDH